MGINTKADKMFNEIEKLRKTLEEHKETLGITEDITIQGSICTVGIFQFEIWVDGINGRRKIIYDTPSAKNEYQAIWKLRHEEKCKSCSNTHTREWEFKELEHLLAFLE